jgi:hypothetical protein
MPQIALKQRGLLVEGSLDGSGSVTQCLDRAR